MFALVTSLIVKIVHLASFVGRMVYQSHQVFVFEAHIALDAPKTTLSTHASPDIIVKMVSAMNARPENTK